jgi:aminopeptidase N
MKTSILAFLLALGLVSVCSSSDIQERREIRHRLHQMEAGRRLVMNQPDSLRQFDVLNYKLDIKFDLSAQTLDGTTEICAASQVAALDSVFLDLVQLTVDSVWTATGPLSFSHAGDVIRIALDSTAHAGDTFGLSVAYHGHPGNEGPSGFGGFYFTPKVAFSMGVGLWTDPPSMGRYWFPCSDVPCDKAVFDMSFTVPLGKVAVSNGTLIDTVPNYAESTMTYVWSEHHPTSTYLVAVSISNYVVVPDSVYPWIAHYVYPEDSAKAVTSFRNVHRMMDAFEASFSPYNFDRFAYVEAPKGDMEHQTCVTHHQSLINGANNYDWILAHELSHHWWGDWVTVADWRDVWLSEGFATYCEAVYQEYIGGLDAYHDYMKNDIMNVYLASGELFPIYDPQNMWGETSYEKGGSVLHMLRHAVGDSLFFGALNAYGGEYAYGNAVTPDFQAVCESVCGQDLDWFFSEWIYDWGYPKYVYTCWQPGPDTVKVIVSQEQAIGPVFTMPVDFRIGTASGDTIIKGWVDSSPETLTFAFAGANTDSFKFDPDEWILKMARNQPGIFEMEDSWRGHLTGSIAAAPNPFSTRTKLTVTLDPSSDSYGARLFLYDVTGRLIKIFNLAGSNGLDARKDQTRVVFWDAKDGHGNNLPGGIYFASSGSEDQRVSHKLVLMR